MNLSREEIARAVGTIADLEGGQKRGFPEIARSLGVSERMVRKWRAMEVECPNDVRLRLLQLQAERLAMRLGETRRLLQQIKGEARARDPVLVSPGDDVQRAWPPRRVGRPVLRAADGAGHGAGDAAEVAA